MTELRPLAAEAWLSQFGRVDHLQVLAALVRHPDVVIGKRRLQQRLHRLPAVKLNRAIDSLVGAGLLVREGASITLPQRLRPVLLRPGDRAGQHLGHHPDANRASDAPRCR